ncbi:hypothetical protein MT418_005813 [Batrachochytrium dendrobatidis]
MQTITAQTSTAQSSFDSIPSLHCSFSAKSNPIAIRQQAYLDRLASIHSADGVSAKDKAEMMLCLAQQYMEKTHELYSDNTLSVQDYSDTQTEDQFQSKSLFDDNQYPSRVTSLKFDSTDRVSVKMTIQNIPEQLMVRIWQYLDVHSLQQSQQVCILWNNAIIRNDHLLWRYLAIHRYPLSSNSTFNQTMPLPKSFCSWKAYYGTHNAIVNGRHDFISMHASFVMHKASWSDLRMRSVDTLCSRKNRTGEVETHTRVSNPVVSNQFVSYCKENILASNASMNHIHNDRLDRSKLRFLMIWPVKTSDFSCMVLDGSSIFWIGNAQKTDAGDSNSDTKIYALDLSETDRSKAQFTLVGHQHTVTKIIGNSEGLLVSIDSAYIVKVWKIASRLCIKTIDSRLTLESDIASINIHHHTLVTITFHGFTHIWNVYMDHPFASFSMHSNYSYDNNGHTVETNSNFHVAIRDSFIGVGVNDGSYFLYEMSPLQESKKPSVEHEYDPKHMLVNPCTSASKLAIFRHQNSSQASSSTCIIPSTNAHKSPLSITCIAKLRDDDIDIHRFTYAPHTFHIGTHYVITNGAYPDELSTWSLTPLANVVPSVPHQVHLRSIYSLRPPSCMVSISNGLFSGSTDLSNLGSNPDMTTTDASGSVYPAYPFIQPAQSSIARLSNPTLIPQHICPPCHSTRTKHMYASSETISIQTSGYFVPPFRDVVYSRMDVDETMLVSNVEFQGKKSLIVWDFRVERVRERRFELCVVGGKDVWICFEVMEDTACSESNLMEERVDIRESGISGMCGDGSSIAFKQSAAACDDGLAGSSRDERKPKSTLKRQHPS